MAQKQVNKPTLNDFFEHVRFSGPFNDDRVDNDDALDDGVIDLPSIHKMEYDKLIDEVEIIQRGGKSKGVVIWGEAGIGKSHLLARFSNWVRKDRHGIYLYLHNLMTPPEEIPEYILKCAISYLTDDRLDRLSGTALYLLINKLIVDALDNHRADAQKAKKDRLKELEEAYMREVDQVLDGCKQLIDRESNLQIYKVLFELYCSAYFYKKNCQKEGEKANKELEEKARLARRWLSVDTLEPEEALKIGIDIRPNHKEDEEADNARLHGGQQVERILIALASLAQRKSQPFVMVFDQCENMDHDQIRALSRFCHALIDHAPNLLIVTCGVQQSLLELKKNQIIDNGAWARIAKDTIPLRSIGKQESIDLLTARVDLFLNPFVSLPDVGVSIKKDRYFPLGSQWIEKRFGDNIDFRPRDIINWASERWKQNVGEIKEHGGEKWLKEWKDSGGGVPPVKKVSQEERARLIDEKVEQKIIEQVNRRELNRAGLPADASNMGGLVYSLLAPCIGVSPYTLTSLESIKSKRNHKSAYDIMATEKRGDDGVIITTGLTFISTGNANTTTFALRRLINDPKPPNHVLVVVEERMPLKLGGKGKEYLNELKRRGEEAFKLQELSFAEYARLDGLQAVIGNARSGDLELSGVENKRVSEAEVITSHHRCDRYRQHPLLCEFLTEGKPNGNGKIPPPDDKLIREFIMAQLALNMGISTNELANKYCALAGNENLSVENMKKVFRFVAMKLHDERKISANPVNDDMYLLLRA
ncbi:MAG: ATP-binding protein [Desulfobulbaceae bacterium]|nr:ATP-binding protein [Desulfobulbaceae bacterium]